MSVGIQDGTVARCGYQTGLCVCVSVGIQGGMVLVSDWSVCLLVYRVARCGYQTGLCVCVSGRYTRQYSDMASVTGRRWWMLVGWVLTVVART